MTTPFDFYRKGAKTINDHGYTSFAYALIGVFLTTVLLATGLSIKKDHDSTMEGQIKQIQDITLIYKNQVTQMLQLVEGVARSSQFSSQQQISKTGSNNLGLSLQQAQFSLPVIRSTSLLTNDFKIVASSNTLNIDKVVDISSFEPNEMLDQQGNSFLISRPWLGRDFSDGEISSPERPIGLDDPYFIPVLLRFQKSWVLMALNPDYIYGQLIKFGANDQYNFELIRSDGIVLLSNEMSLPGVRSSSIDKISDIHSSHTRFIDGVDFLSYGEADKFPVHVVVSRMKKEVLRTWLNEKIGFFIWMLTSIISGIVASWILLFKLKEDQVKQKNQQVVVNKLSQALEQSPGGVLITDVRGVVEYCNASYCEMLNTTFDFVVGELAVMLDPKHMSEFMINEIKSTILGGGVWFGDFVHPGAVDYHWLEVQVIWSPLFNENNQISNFICIEHNVTQLKKMQIELSYSRDQAEASTRAKSEFLANISHEIRTPLSGVIGMTSLALDEDISPKAREYVSNAKTSAVALLSILNDILDFSKMEAGKLQLDLARFNFYLWLDGLVMPHSISAQQKGLEFQYAIDQDVPRWMVSDALRLSQIINNILSNSIKFTKNGFVKLRVSIDSSNSRDENKGINLKFLIEDTGCGMSPGEIKKLFQPFSQANYSTSRVYGGTGLGLVICKRLATAFNGHISLVSELGVGTEFSVVIPVEALDVQDNPMPQVMDHDNHAEVLTDVSLLDGMKVLLVEDHPFNRQMMMVLLGKIGLVVDVAVNGSEALTKLNSMPSYYDVVLMDIQMPIMDGITATREIRAQAIFNDLPIIAVTANAMSDEKDACIRAGMQAYLVKPVNPSALQDVLLSWAGRHKSV